MIYDVTQSPFNAVGDGVADDQPAIQAAIDAAEAAGGGIVYIPKGTYLLATLLASNSPAIQIDDDNVKLRGDGVGLSKIVLAPGLNNHLLNIYNCSGFEVSNLEFNQDGTNQSAGHAIRGHSITEGLIRDCKIVDTASYGIGIQDGTISGVRIENIDIELAGADGIDIKNKNDNNGVNFMSNIRIKSFGVGEHTIQAGIDIRGVWIMDNIHVEGVLEGNSGIRFRQGETTDDSGYGGHGSVLNNFYVEADTTTNTTGVNVSAYQVAINGGRVLNCTKGVALVQMESTVGHVIAIGCNDGFYLDAAGLASQADRCVLTGCIARSCTDSGFKIFTDYNNLDHVVARSNFRGINIRSGANHTTLSGISVSSSDTNLYNAGTNTHNNLSVS